jgi:putative Ca2+/H+ antiporter (TMEM165/GDT1 family)
MVVAFGFQLAVLPGEKVQFIIAGLSTRYSPFVVVAAAGSAFAGWTALEILLGEALRGALPELYLDLLTAGLFALFGAMLYRSAPVDGETPAEPDGGFRDAGERDIEVLGVALPDTLATFLGIFSMMAVGEVGDKTQLITISLAVQHGATTAIWVGERLAIVPVSIANAYLFHRFSHRIDLRKAHFLGAGVFWFFALDTMLALATGISVWESVVNAVAGAVLAVTGAA